MNIATIRVQSLSSSYSSDFQSTSGSYLQAVPNTIATVFEGDPIIVTGNAPFTSVMVSPSSSTDNTLFTGVTSVSINFSDVLNSYAVILSGNNFISLSATHVYKLPGTYPIIITLYTSSIISTYTISNVQVIEIPPKPVINVKNMDGTNFNYELSAGLITPYTLQFYASGSIPGSFPIETLTWDFGDNNIPITTTRFETVTSDLFYPDIKDPRNYFVQHTYNRLLDSSTSSISATLSASASITDSIGATVYGPLGPFQLQQANERRLIKSRLFGAENKLLLIFEDVGTKYIYQQLITL